MQIIHYVISQLGMKRRRLSWNNESEFTNLETDGNRNEHSSSKTERGKTAGIIQKVHLDATTHITTLYTAQDHAWIKNYYLPFDKENREFPIAERKTENSMKVNRFSRKMLSKYGLPCKFITVTGNGGTGKLYTGILIVSVSPRIVCMASTQVGWPCD